MNFGSHPLNLALRFLLEITALLSVGFWGWHQYNAWIRFPLAILLPLLLAAIWGIFAVPNDPSRSGKAPVVISGVLRLLLEFCIFGLAIWALFHLNYILPASLLMCAVFLHYLVSFDRIRWLLHQ